MKRTLMFIAVLALLGSACAVEETGSQKVTSSEEAPTTEPLEKEETPSEEVSSDVAKVGGSEGFVFDDGLEVYVEKIKDYQVSDFGFGHKAGNTPVVFVVRFINGSADSVDLTLTTVNVRSGKEGATAEQIFDQGVGDGFSGKVAPGRNASAKYAFSLEQGSVPGPVDIEVEPGFLDYDSALFAGRVK